MHFQLHNLADPCVSTSGLDQHVGGNFLLKNKAVQDTRFWGRIRPAENIKPGSKTRWGEPSRRQTSPVSSCSLGAVEPHSSAPRATAASALSRLPTSLHIKSCDSREVLDRLKCKEIIARVVFFRVEGKDRQEGGRRCFQISHPFRELAGFKWLQ